MAVAEFLVEMLPLDASGRRAVDETIADWGFEAEAAATDGARLVADVRGVVALGSTLLRLTLSQSRSLSAWRALAATMLLAMLLAALLFAVPLLRTFEALRAEDVSVWASVRMSLALIPQTFGVSVVLAVMAMPASRFARDGSLLGVALLLTALSAFNLGYIVPSANQSYRGMAYSELRRLYPHDEVLPPGVTRGPAELTATDMVGDLSGGSAADRQRAIQALNSRGALLLMIPIGLLIGVQARRVAAGRRWYVKGWGLAWLVACAGWVASELGVAYAQTWLRVWGYREAAAFVTLYRGWALPLTCVLILFGLARPAAAVEHRQAARA